MKHKHSLKEGMIINPPSVSEKSAVFSLAKSLGFKFEDCGQGFKMITPIIFYKGVITNRFFDRSVSTSIPYKAVTFIEFVTAMLTPEKDTPDYSEGDALLKEHLDKREKDTPDNDSAQAEERTHRGEPEEVQGRVLSSDEIQKKEEYLKIMKIELQDQMPEHWSSERKMAKAKKVFHSMEQDLENDRLKLQVETLKQKLAEVEKKGVVEEDRRVDFGEEITFKVSRSKHHAPAFIGGGLAKKGDKNKVLIAEEGYTFKIREDYYDGRPALEIHRL